MKLQKNNPTTGTTTPLFIPKETDPQVIQADESYFLVKIIDAQAAFSGRLWEKIKRLVITSQVSLNHPQLGTEPLRAIQRSREVQKNRAEKLGLSSNLISLVPATMDHISISIEFVLDKENRLGKLGGLINDDAFISAISLAPGASTAARTIGNISQKIIQTFLAPDERQPILQFNCDFNIATGELKEGYYVILGTRDEQSPLPRPVPDLKIKDGELFANETPVTQWSYIVLSVRHLEARTRALNDGASWESKFREAESIALQISEDPFADDKERQSVKKN
ncbi:hypothetical protein QUF76_13240 [Desulfobacterales bacterium HSG16]|nr:hypothetical protein [Desulfobacterales bacterium HSG16]